VTSPRLSASRVSALDVPIGSRAQVTGLERAAAHGTRGPAGFHDGASAFDEVGRLASRQREAGAGALLGGGLSGLDRFGRRGGGLLLRRLVFDRLVGHDEDPIRLLVVPNAHRTDVPDRLDRPRQRPGLRPGPAYPLLAQPPP